MKAIVLDSTPLGLIVNRPGHPAADACRVWLTSHLNAGVRIYVPAIIVYELRRELLRIDSTASLSLLNRFIHAEPERYIALTNDHLTAAAELWAASRRKGFPTADPHALDIDVILSAQALSLNIPTNDYVVATSNIGHLSQFVPARPWQEV